jgi:acyl-coenzyme A thioesterase PaaI-like protein
VDFVSLYTVRGDPTSPRGFQSTINMRIDYFEPIIEGSFEILGQTINQRGKNSLVSTSFTQNGNLAVYAITTMREIGEV